MEDVAELLARGLFRAFGTVLQALFEFVFELAIRGLARLIYGRGGGPWVRVRRIAFRAVALGSSIVAMGAVRDAEAPEGQVAAAIMASVLLLIVMCAGEEEHGSSAWLVWAAVAALMLLLCTLVAQVL